MRGHEFHRIEDQCFSGLGMWETCLGSSKIKGKDERVIRT